MQVRGEGDEGETIVACPSCGAKDLYLQKDFPRKWAIPIVLVGLVTVPWTYGLSLIAVALIDFVLYRIVPWMLVCYRCRTQHRGYRATSEQKEFDRHLDELYRYGE